MEALYLKGVVSAQKRDEAEAQYKAMVATESAARSQYEMVRKGAQSEDKEAAAAMVTAAQGGVEQVKSVLADSYLTAPIDGEISEIFPHVSELVGTGRPHHERFTTRRHVGNLQRARRVAAIPDHGERDYGPDPGSRQQDRHAQNLFHQRYGHLRRMARHQSNRQLRRPHI